MGSITGPGGHWLRVDAQGDDAAKRSERATVASLSASLCACLRLGRRSNLSSGDPMHTPFGRQSTLGKLFTARSTLPAAELPEAIAPSQLERSAEESALVAALRAHAGRVCAEHGLDGSAAVLTEQRLLRYARFIDEPLSECERFLLLRQQLGLGAVAEAVAQGRAFPGEREMQGVWEHNLFGAAVTDREGRPVFIATIGGLSCTRRLLVGAGEQSARAHLLHALEALNARVSALSEQRQLLLSYTYVLDASGFSFWQACVSDSGRAFFAQLGAELNRLAVPALIARVLLVRVPPQWQLIWNAARLVLPPKVQRKVHVCSDAAELARFIEPAQLPARYGGSCADAACFVRQRFEPLGRGRADAGAHERRRAEAHAAAEGGKAGGAPSGEAAEPVRSPRSPFGGGGAGIALGMLPGGHSPRGGSGNSARASSAASAAGADGAARASSSSTASSRSMSGGWALGRPTGMGRGPPTACAAASSAAATTPAQPATSGAVVGGAVGAPAMAGGGNSGVAPTRSPARSPRGLGIVGGAIGGSASPKAPR